jgi:imidazolonepropionase
VAVIIHNHRFADLVIAGASELVICAGQNSVPGIIYDGWLAVKDGKIIAVGSKEKVEVLIGLEETAIYNANGKVVAPGFIDCHTHLVFGGSRVDEYTAGLTGSSIVELEKKGIKTGIMATVEASRAASKDDLFQAASSRLNRMLKAGTTTVESKSGYGLSLESEIKILEVNKMLNQDSPVDIISTFLGAHGWPHDLERKDYQKILVNEMIPRVSELGLAQFCDIWCDDGYYSVKESEEILSIGLKHGLKPKIHTDAYSDIGGSDLAASMKMVSADHLNYTPRSAMEKLAKAGVTGVLLPALDFAVQHQKPFDYQSIKEAGMKVALATNLCPGCWCESMQFVMMLACRLYEMAPMEAIQAATIGAARALQLQDNYGSLEAGKYADLQIWSVARHEDVIYRLGGNVVEKVYKKGKLVADNLC